MLAQEPHERGATQGGQTETEPQGDNGAQAGKQERGQIGTDDLHSQ